MGEQVNQRFDLVPLARPNRLHDTRLKPTHRAMNFGPVNTVPVHRRVGSRTSGCCFRRHICDAPNVGSSGSLVTEDPRDVSVLSRPRISSVGRTTSVSVSLQHGVCFFPHPDPAVPSATFACHVPPQWSMRLGEQRGYFVHRIDREGFGCVSRPMARHPWLGNAEVPTPGNSPFWSRPVTAALAG